MKGPGTVSLSTVPQSLKEVSIATLHCIYACTQASFAGMTATAHRTCTCCSLDELEEPRLSGNKLLLEVLCLLDLWVNCRTCLYVVGCQLSSQEAAHGPVTKCLEFWVERWMPYVECTLRGHISRNPEAQFMNNLCVQEALRALAGQPGMKSIRDWCPEYMYGVAPMPQWHSQCFQA